MPPSKGVPSGPWMSASHRNRSSSLSGPAVIPSGGSTLSDLYSEKRRLEATDEAISDVGVGCRGVLGEVFGGMEYVGLFVQ